MKLFILKTIIDIKIHVTPIYKPKALFFYHKSTLKPNIVSCTVLPLINVKENGDI